MRQGLGPIVEAALVMIAAPLTDFDDIDLGVFGGELFDDVIDCGIGVPANEDAGGGVALQELQD